MRSGEITVREASPADYCRIREVLINAFGGAVEADLVERLRANNHVISELVASRNGEIVGEIMFSRLDVVIEGREVAAGALAPVAVIPSEQRQGIGSKLIAKGLRTLQSHGVEAVLVLGHPEYYPRFGFSSDLARHLDSPYQGDAFMALELFPGVLSGASGIVRYPDAFRALD